MKKITPIVWVLADDRAGNTSQSLGVAELLDIPFEVKRIRYNDFVQLPNILRGTSLLGVDLDKSSSLTPTWPDIVIATGRRTAPIARYIKKKSDNKTVLIHLMWPGKPTQDFDLIAVPEHDNIQPQDNILVTTGAPNRINHTLLDMERKKWHEKFNYLPHPRIALLVGGTTKKHIFTEKHALDLAQKASFFMHDTQGSLLVTTSRRTSDEATEMLLQNLKTKFYFYDYKKGGENPFLAYLALSDAIIATGDSISMCSEACSTHKPVFIYAPDELIPDKHQSFLKNLYRHNNAKPLEGTLQAWDVSPLNDTTKLVAYIKEKYC